MSEFADLVARAVNPTMTRAEREAVYVVVKAAVQRLQDRDGLEPGDPLIALQQHLVEETIRDVETDIARFRTLDKLERTLAAQIAAEAAAGTAR